MTRISDTAVYGVIDKITGKLVGHVGSKEDCDNEINARVAREGIREAYDLVTEVLEDYVDMNKDYYTIISLWIIGTYLHHEFESFPYLFLNAMRGSAKTRTLKLICAVAKDGNLLTSPTEAVLFRMNGTLGLDEFEGVASKDKQAVRELLNASYKKGIKVYRMKKKKVLGQEEQVVEEFEPYRPIAMANIWGMEEVLGDRCISLTLEKSDDPLKTRLIEDFQTNEKIKKVKDLLNRCRLCRDVMKKNIYQKWNLYLFQRHKTTLTTLNTHTTQTTQTTPLHRDFNKLFNKIHDSEIKGRNLELFMPLLLVASIINDTMLKDTIEIATKLTKERKHEEEIESRDVMLIDYISQQEQSFDFIQVKEITAGFKNFCDEDGEWLNSKWVGRALKRLNLIIDKKRTGLKGREVILNTTKAKEKLKMFRE